MIIKTLDLHGMTHEDAKREVIRFIEKHFNDTDVEMEVITGHSTRMKGIVLNTLEEYNLSPNIGSMCNTQSPKIIFWFT